MRCLWTGSLSASALTRLALYFYNARYYDALIADTEYLGVEIMNNEHLSDVEKNLLLKCIKNYAPSLISKYNQLETGLLSPDDVNGMREAVGAEIAEKGFLKNNKQSYEYGLELEELIDRLADLYLWPKKD